MAKAVRDRARRSARRHARGRPVSPRAQPIAARTVSRAPLACPVSLRPSTTPDTAHATASGTARRTASGTSPSAPRPTPDRPSPSPSGPRALVPPSRAPRPHPHVLLPRNQHVRDPAGCVRVRTRLAGLVRPRGIPGARRVRLAQAKLRRSRRASAWWTRRAAAGCSPGGSSRAGTTGASWRWTLATRCFGRRGRLRRRRGCVDGKMKRRNEPGGPPVRPRGHREDPDDERQRRGRARGGRYSLLAAAQEAVAEIAGCWNPAALLRHDVPHPAASVRGRRDAAAGGRGDAGAAGGGGGQGGRRQGFRQWNKKDLRDCASSAGWWISSATSAAGSSSSARGSPRPSHKSQALAHQPVRSA